MIDIETGEHIPNTMEPGAVGGQLPACDPVTHEIICNRIAVSKVIKLLPEKFITDLERNQKLASCCRHPENHEIEGLRSAATESVDIYKMYCDCGKIHTRFMCGDAPRPAWTRR